MAYKLVQDGLLFSKVFYGFNQFIPDIHISTNDGV